jgi:hypothetical protein
MRPHTRRNVARYRSSPADWGAAGRAATTLRGERRRGEHRRGEHPWHEPAAGDSPQTTAPAAEGLSVRRRDLAPWAGAATRPVRPARARRASAAGSAGDLLPGGDSGARRPALSPTPCAARRISRRRLTGTIGASSTACWADSVKRRATRWRDRSCAGRWISVEERSRRVVVAGPTLPARCSARMGIGAPKGDDPPPGATLRRPGGHGAGRARRSSSVACGPSRA